MRRRNASVREEKVHQTMGRGNATDREEKVHQTVGRSSTSDWEEKNAPIWEEVMHHIRKKKCIILERTNTVHQNGKKNCTRLGKRNASVRGEKVKSA